LIRADLVGGKITKYTAFFDESYTQDIYFISALVVPVETLEQVGLGVKDLLESLRTVLDPLPSELHASELMSGRGAWWPIRRNTRQKIRILRETLRVIADTPTAIIFTEGTDVKRLNHRYRYPENPHTTTFRHLLEEIDRWASTRAAEISLVADDIGTEKIHQVEFRAYQESGTGGYLPRLITNLSGPIEFLDSRNSPGLQLADAVVYLFRRREYLQRTGASPQAIYVVNSLLSEIKKQVHRFRFWTP
jgi:hypothetical protein